MDKTYEKLLGSGIDLAPLGVEQGENETYFCTPRGASFIGWEGVDGIHYCFVRGYGPVVFAVSPMNSEPDYVHAVARDFADFLRLLLACGHGAAIEQCWNWDRQQFDAFRAENLATDEARAVMDQIREKLALEPMDDPWGYIHELQAGFDYGRIKYSDPEAIPSSEPGETKEWVVRYGFGREKPGIEIPVNARFNWAGRDVCIPAVYSFAKGLIIDVAMATDTQTMRDFLAKWAPGGRARYSDFNKLDHMRIRYENPTSFLFKVTAIVNGRELHYESASGNGWAPIEGWEHEGARDWVEHYGLEEDRCWQFSRIRFPWKRRMEVKTLSARLSAETAKIPGEPFTVSGAGETVALTNPETGKRYELTVKEYVPLTLDTEDMDEEWEYPTRYMSVEYTLAPDATEQEVYLTDVSEGDKPRRRQTPDGFYPTATGAIFAMMRSDAEGRHSSASSFYFEPPESVTWAPVFRLQPWDDFETRLI